MAYIAVACQAMILVVFAASAVSKLRSRRAFASFSDSLRSMRLVPPRWARPAAAYLVAAEVCVVVLLISPATPRLVGFIAGMSLVTVLTVGVLIAIRHGTQTACPCFGPSNGALGRRHVIRNLVLLLVAAAGVVTDGSTTAVHAAGLAIGAMAGTVAALVVVFLDDIIDLVAAPLPTTESIASLTSPVDPKGL